MSANTLGRYQIIREIARSNDIVYEALDASINRRVALKELALPPNLSGQQRTERVQRFYREARAAGSLSHPNIVTIFEAGEDQGRHFIAMEYLEGQTLRDVIEIEGRLPIDRAVDISKQICEGLAYAHSRSIVHRDIKPDNIQILPNGRIKITDFGIARLMDEPSITSNGQVFGTPSYMSPEQVAGKILDHRSDIFSFGVVLYEMLNGRKPFVGDSVVTITYNIMNHEVTIPPSVPPYLERVLRRCLAKDPNMRYSSAADIKLDLESPTSNGFVMPTQGPDPFGPTVAAPGPLYGPSQMPPPQPMPGPLPMPGPGAQYGTMRSDDIRLPRMPAKPILSHEAKYFLKVMIGVLFACSAVVAFIWALSAGYQGFQKQTRLQDVQATINTAQRYFESQSYEAAAAEWTKVLQMTRDPEIIKTTRRNIAMCYVKSGLQLENAGDYPGAMTRYTQALIYDKTHSDVYLFLANIQDKQGRRNEALATYQKAIEVEPGSEASNTARQNLAYLYIQEGDAALRRGQSDAAIGWWRKALDLAPGTQAGFQAQNRLDQQSGTTTE